jgi:glucose/arabinose dehydrogenase
MTRIRLSLPAAACGLVLTAVSLNASVAQTQTFQSEHHPYRVVTVVSGLQDPWSIAFLPSGEMLVTEKPGRLRVVKNGVLRPEPIAGTPTVRYRGQGGLLEVALHPNFAANRLIYLSFAKPNDAQGTQGTTAILRGRLNENLTAITDAREIFEAKVWANGNGHFAGKMAFDPRGYLFLTVGDRQVNPLSVPTQQHPAQGLGTHHGKVLRLHDDGRVPADNPFVGRAGALPEIYSYGHRNPQGLAIDQQTGAVYTTEHGPQGGDELNLILPGKNYGWPVIGYGVQYGGQPIHEGRERQGMEQPLQHWTPSIAASGLMLYTGNAFPMWKNNLFVGGLAGEQIARVPLATREGRTEIGRMERPPLMYGYGRIRDIRQGPEGFIYIAIDGGDSTEIVRMEPAT